MKQSRMKPTLPTFSEKELTVRKMFDRIAPRYDLLNRIITFGLDTKWRKKTVKQIDTHSGGKILDVACGTGDLCDSLHKAGMKAIGMDFSRGMLNSFNSNAPLINGDALKIPIHDSSVDGVTCGFALRNFLDINPFLNEVARILKPGSRVALLEVDEPENRYMKMGHSFYFNKIVPFIGGLFSDKDAYSYLPRSVVYLPEENEIIKMIEGAGLSKVKKIRLTGGIAQLLVAEKPKD
ncbi:MAG: ubiquinone/menaquinone biosynthesis methyltransferase [Acidimicrobiales bacterium]|nr:ubiquinone biosynthesis methyltransferase UbiE [Acidimicrobiaceae bacterium]MDP6161870.1 ubiquinone/menaquinone biosynthesis methyltransferase [Acidimicrobiales bacterium]MDP6284762.1 ubiquinone/menaquinone biosynthesis methyltransferase [Acidimicrobiales bacterium]HJL91066.1 ubiquinone/menaquinone biosynthesis methyltransferase [Acidimicrobiales bacterium]HJO41596.1 ubiquinone/menaquinone biosynthesis methyltransferase [Acidimicrobiales bacterium]|tara:strand:- start:167 stop:874 length:708 start_codon:yes stop_codon:yes gene_type:complete